MKGLIILIVGIAVLSYGIIKIDLRAVKLGLFASLIGVAIEYIEGQRDENTTYNRPT